MTDQAPLSIKPLTNGATSILLRLRRFQALLSRAQALRQLE